MALSLSLRLGEDVYAGDERLVVSAVASSQEFTLQSSSGAFRIVADRAVKVLPNVFVSAGREPHPGSVRLLIDAPRDVVILRGEKYRDKPEPAQFRVFRPTPEAIEDAEGLGLRGDLVDLLADMARHATSSPNGPTNMQYEGYGLQIEGGEVCRVVVLFGAEDDAPEHDVVENDPAVKVGRRLEKGRLQEVLVRHTSQGASGLTIK